MLVEESSVAVQTDQTTESYLQLQEENAHLIKQLALSKFRLCNMLQDDEKIKYYTGFPIYATIKAFYIFLGPAVDNLNYWGSSTVEKSQTDYFH
jgi:hypothetical protein